MQAALEKIPAACRIIIGDLSRAHVEQVSIALGPSQATEPCTTTVRARYESFVDAVGTHCVGSHSDGMSGGGPADITIKYCVHCV